MNKKKMKKGMQWINFPTQAALNMGMRHEVSSPKLIFRMKFECILWIWTSEPPEQQDFKSPTLSLSLHLSIKLKIKLHTSFLFLLSTSTNWGSLH
jgi:hypothetical protein